MASGHPTLSNIQTRNDIFVDNHCGMTIEAGKPWFDMLEENHIICTSDIYSLDPFITQMLEVQGVKAIAVFPLS